MKSELGSKHGTSVPSFREKVGTRLRELEKRFKNRESAAKAAGVAKSTLQNWIEGNTDPSFEGLARLTAAVGASLDELATGRPPTGTSAVEDFIGIPRYDARLAAGDGAFNERARRIDDIPFTREFLQRKLGRNTADGLAILEARGDSMEPTIGDGDLVLVDRRQDGLEDGIMAFVRDDTAYVKRIRCLLDGVEIISDNRDVYEPLVVSRERLDELAIIGRVRWIGRVLGR